MATWSKDFLLEFIELFKTLEPLWLIKSKDYYNKTKKNNCFNILLEKVLRVDPTATKETVTKKINNIRSTFRKEHKRVRASLVSGASADEVYVPKLWYYSDLLFLRDQEEPLQSTSSIDISVEAKVESPSTEEWTSDNIASPDIPMTNFKRKHSRTNESQDILRMVGDRLTSIRQEDEFDVIGKNIALKLRMLNNIQKLYAEKIINDTLFEAQLNNLNRYSRLSNPCLPRLGYANQEIDNTNVCLNNVQEPVYHGTANEIIMHVNPQSINEIPADLEYSTFFISMMMITYYI